MNQFQSQNQQHCVKVSVSKRLLRVTYQNKPPADMTYLALFPSVLRSLSLVPIGWNVSHVRKVTCLVVLGKITLFKGKGLTKSFETTTSSTTSRRICRSWGLRAATSILSKRRQNNSLSDLFFKVIGCPFSSLDAQIMEKSIFVICLYVKISFPVGTVFFSGKICRKILLDELA